MKKRYFGIAFLIFIALMLLIYASTFFIFLGVMMTVFLIGGEQGWETGMNYLMDSSILLNMFVYIICLAVVLPCYYFAFVEKKGIKQTVAAHTKRLTPMSILWTFLLALSAAHAISLLMVFVDLLAPAAMESYMEMMDVPGLSSYSLTWIVAILILPPLMEETVFRGLILQYMSRSGTRFWAANTLQAFLFGLFHMNIVQGIYAFLLGLILGYLAYRYDSLFLPMLMHFFFNLFGTVLMDIEGSLLSETVQGILVLGSVPVMAAVLMAIHFRIGEKRKR